MPAQVNNQGIGTSKTKELYIDASNFQFYTRTIPKAELAFNP
jgi:hypothetical protein